MAIRNLELVLAQNIDFQIGFLQGIFDAKGSVRLNRKHITTNSNNMKTISVVTRLLNDI